MEIQTFLSKIYLFESLSLDQLKHIETSTSIKKLHKDEHLFTEGQIATAFFIVYSGRVKIYKLSADGNEQILHIQEPGDLVAEAIIFDFTTYPAYCQAMENTVLIRFSKAKFHQLLKHFPEITFKMMSAYSRRMRQLVAVIEELSFHDVKSRLANYLIKNCIVKNNKNFCPLNLTKKDLASVLGTIPETLSRTLLFFKKENIITEEQNQIILLDAARLKSFIQ